MKYLSVCSGIEAATVAWHGLGWEPVAFAEIEAFPATVLSHHYPTVPNLGDLTKYREWPVELLAEVELLVGGTPCQAFSVAGQRRSLDDERGNLSLVYVNLYHHINEARRSHGRPPAIALWENVPGVLSTKDNAFGCFIGGLLGCDEAPATESGKWDKAGFLGSEAVRVGYRVLDAQYFGVAQRRRRVFLIAVPCELVERFGERACPSEILSLRESVLGNPPTRGAAREGAARDTAACSANSGGCVAGTLDSNYHKGGGERAGVEREVVVAFGGNKTSGPLDVATSCLANGSPHGRQDFASETFIVDGHPNPAYALSAGKQGEGGVFGSGRDSQDTFVVHGASAIFTGDGVVADPIGASESRTYTNEGTTFRLHNCVGVCATGEKTHALTTRRACEEDGTGRGTPIVPAVAFSDSAAAHSYGVAQTVEHTPPLRGGQGGNVIPAVAFKPGQSEAAGGTFVTEEFTPTIQSQNNGSTAIPAIATPIDMRQASRGEKVTNNRSQGSGGPPGHGVGDAGDPAFTVSERGQAVAIDLQNVAIGGDVAGTLDTTRPSRGGGQAVAFTKSKRAQSNQDNESWVPGNVAPTQNQFDVGDTRATTVVAFTQNSRDEVRQINGDGSVSGALSADAGMHQTNYLAFAQNQLGEVRVNADVMGTVNQNQNASGRNTPMVQSAMQVRRLCPSECEALQGFPVGYTAVQYRNKPAADGPRYRALGNSMAVPCMWWLGLRIQQATK